MPRGGDRPQMPEIRQGVFKGTNARNIRDRDITQENTFNFGEIAARYRWKRKVGATEESINA